MKRWPLIASFLLFLLLCASLAYWGLQLLQPPQRAVAAPPRTLTAAVAPEAGAVLFGGARKGPVASNFQLHGVILAGTADDSVAILSTGGKPPRAVPVDKEAAPGVVVKEVHRDHVVLSENGAVRRVELPERATAQLSAARTSPIAPRASPINPPPATAVQQAPPQTSPQISSQAAPSNAPSNSQPNPQSNSQSNPQSNLQPSTSSQTGTASQQISPRATATFPPASTVSNLPSTATPSTATPASPSTPSTSSGQAAPAAPGPSTGASTGAASNVVPGGTSSVAPNLAPGTTQGVNPPSSGASVAPGQAASGTITPPPSLPGGPIALPSLPATPGVPGAPGPLGNPGPAAGSTSNPGLQGSNGR